VRQKAGARSSWRSWGEAGMAIWAWDGTRALCRIRLLFGSLMQSQELALGPWSRSSHLVAEVKRAISGPIHTGHSSVKQRLLSRGSQARNTQRCRLTHRCYRRMTKFRNGYVLYTEPHICTSLNTWQFDVASTEGVSVWNCLRERR
jgi:hypothetical protein